MFLEDVGRDMLLDVIQLQLAGHALKTLVGGRWRALIAATRRLSHAAAGHPRGVAAAALLVAAGLGRRALRVLGDSRVRLLLLPPISLLLARLIAAILGL